jgi:hypothetical protein
MAARRGYVSTLAGSVPDRPLDDLVQNVSEQAVVLARQQVELARREITTKMRRAGAGATMVGGAGFLAALASGTATAGLVLLLSRRPGPSAAALGVAGAYAGLSAVLAREGLARVREAGPLLPEEAVQNAKHNLGSAKRGTKSARKPAQSTQQARPPGRPPLPVPPARGLDARPTASRR